MSSSWIRVKVDNKFYLRSLRSIFMTTSTPAYPRQTLRRENITKEKKNFSISLTRPSNFININLLNYLRHFKWENAIDERICGWVESCQTLYESRNGNIRLTFRYLLVHLKQVKNYIWRPTRDENFGEWRKVERVSDEFEEWK